jgi:hypothetical protein
MNNNNKIKMELKFKQAKSNEAENWRVIVRVSKNNNKIK